jgi:hypothetical protein
MNRSTLVFILFLGAACGGRVEQLVLRGYFDLCAVADDVALENVALVTLDPRRDGVVGHFRVVRIRPRLSGPPTTGTPRVVSLSLSGRPAPDGGAPILVSEEVELVADVHRDGSVRQAPMTVTLSRAETQQVSGRWIVVRLVLDGRTLPAASSGLR